MREVPAQEKFVLKKYTISIQTGNVRGAGTDANVFINITGAKVQRIIINYCFYNWN